MMAALFDVFDLCFHMPSVFWPALVKLITFSNIGNHLQRLTLNEN